jgi:hypothetical protein
MLKLLQAFIARIKALLALAASWALEADVLLCHAEIKAELLRQARRYEDEGLEGLANELRQHAEELGLQPPRIGLPIADPFATSAAQTPPADTETPGETITPAALPDPSTPRKPARKQRSQPNQEVKP